MDYAGRQHDVDEAFERIEGSIFPGVSMMLDALLDMSAACRPGVDAAGQASELHKIARQLESLTREVAALSPARDQAEACDANISA